MDNAQRAAPGDDAPHLMPFASRRVPTKTSAAQCHRPAQPLTTPLVITARMMKTTFPKLWQAMTNACGAGEDESE